MEKRIASLLELEDYELIMTLSDEVRSEFSRIQSDAQWEQVPDCKFILLAAGSYDLEMQNGGLYQFFTNAGFQAPVLAQALRGIGAQEHAQLFEAFCREHQIDVTHLEDFLRSHIREFFPH